MRPELYLARELERRGIKPANLVDAVRETATRLAADINRRGLEEQIAYLIDDGLEPDDIRQIVGLAREEIAA